MLQVKFIPPQKRETKLCTIGNVVYLQIFTYTCLKNFFVNLYLNKKKAFHFIYIVWKKSNLPVNFIIFGF